MSNVIWAAILLLLVAGCAGERAATTTFTDPLATPTLPSAATEDQAAATEDEENPIRADELIDVALLAPSSDEECLVDTEFDYEEEYEDGRDSVEGAAALNLALARPSIEEFGSIVEERLTVDQSGTLLAAQDVVSVLAGGRVINPGASRRVVVGPEDTDARPARAVFEDLGRGWVITHLVVFGENDGCDGLYGDG